MAGVGFSGTASPTPAGERVFCSVTTANADRDMSGFCRAFALYLASLQHRANSLPCKGRVTAPHSAMRPDQQIQAIEVGKSWLREQSGANPSPPKNSPGPRLPPKKGGCKIQNNPIRRPARRSEPLHRKAAARLALRLILTKRVICGGAKIQLDFGRFRQPGPPGKGRPTHGLREFGTTYLQHPGSSGIIPVKRAAKPRSLTNF